MKFVRFATDALAVKAFVLVEIDILLNQGYEIIIICTYDDVLENILRGRGVKYLPLKLRRNISLYHDIKALISLVKIFLVERPAIVHTITPKAGLLGMVAAKLVGTKRRIHDYVGMVQETKKGVTKLILNVTDRITCGCATAVYANSYSLSQKVIGNNIVSPNKLHVINKGSSYGVNLQKFNRDSLDPAILGNIETQIKYTKDNQYLLFAGRLVRDKGIEELIGAFKHLNASHPQLRLILAGFYEQNLDAISLATINEIENNKNIIQFSWTDKLEYYLALSTMLVHPSHREGFPNILLEAGAMKCPIVCSNATGNIDLITDSKTGLLFNVANRDQMIDKIEFALKNPELMSVFSENLYLDIVKDFSQELILSLNSKKYE